MPRMKKATLTSALLMSLAGCGQMPETTQVDREQLTAATTATVAAAAPEQAAPSALAAPDVASELVGDADHGEEVVAPEPPDRPVNVITQWQRQQTGYWCGPASIRIAVSARTPSPPTQQQIADYVGTTEAGTHRDQVESGMNHWMGGPVYKYYNLNSPMTNGEINDFWSRIKGNADHGYATPVGINVVAGGPRPPGYGPNTNVDHWIVVTGYWFDGKDNHVIVSDPASGRSGFNHNPSYSMTLWLLTRFLKTYVA